MVADRTTPNQLSLNTTYVCGLRSGSRLVQQTTVKQDSETFTSDATYHALELFGQVFILKCLSFPQVWLFSSYLHTLSLSEGKCQDNCNCHLCIYLFFYTVYCNVHMRCTMPPHPLRASTGFTQERRLYRRRSSNTQCGICSTCAAFPMASRIALYTRGSVQPNRLLPTQISIMT